MAQKANEVGPEPEVVTEQPPQYQASQSSGGPQYGAPAGPGPQHHTTVVLSQPSAARLGIRQNQRDWSTGICGCFEDPGGCCFGCFCNCLEWMQIAAKLDESCCVPCCLVGGQLALRTKLRTQHGIRGTICDDCMMLWCCWCLAGCQMTRELRYINNHN